MSLKIPYENLSSASEAYEAIKSQITPETLAQWKIKADFDYKSDDLQIVAKGKGFELTVNFTDQAAVVDLELSFLLKPLRGKITSSLESELKKVL